ncbi:MAG: hypothetical protein CMB99_01955 [Flavobacteriaceae bacterium]|nr:hypothetical protein [Flavobacteriaceae bacterium]|tara:strand:- start:38379 stop:39281 length:903 start_codon:yes stop_codon:yes gene_type:complete
MKNLRYLLPLVICLTLLISCNEKSSFVSFTYPEGKTKALVLSYDDGAIEDIQLAKLFDDNKLIGTFNLNSKYFSTTRGWPQQNGDTIYQRYIPKDSLLIIYKNHEIAAHGAYHKNFFDISDEEILEELNTDIELLEKFTNRKVISMAYPFGNANDSIAKLVGSTGLLNGRTIADTFAFGFPENDMLWHPTCHDSKALNYLDAYLNLNQQELSVFYVWGHSWELKDETRWNNMVTFCKKIGQSRDIWSVSHGELTTYKLALDQIQMEGNQISNPSESLSVWLKLTNGIKELKPGASILLNP